MKTSEARRAILHTLETLRPLVEELEATTDSHEVPRSIKHIMDALPMPAWVQDEGGRLWHQNRASREAYSNCAGCTHRVCESQDRDAHRRGGLAVDVDHPECGEERVTYRVTTTRLNGGFLAWGVGVLKHPVEGRQDERAALATQAR